MTLCMTCFCVVASNFQINSDFHHACPQYTLNKPFYLITLNSRKTVKLNHLEKYSTHSGLFIFGSFIDRESNNITIPAMLTFIAHACITSEGMLENSKLNPSSMCFQTHKFAF